MFYTVCNPSAFSVDDMMERGEQGPDVCLYIGPDKNTEQDTRQRRCISHAPYHIQHMYCIRKK